MRRGGARRSTAAAAAVVICGTLIIGGCSSTSAPQTARQAAATGGGQSAVESPSASPTGTAAASVPGLETVADGLLTDWNAGNGAAAATRYDERANLFVVTDSGDLTESYAGTAEIAASIEERGRHGFAITRTGDVQAHGALAAFPTRWSSTDEYGAGDGVMVLELAWGHRILAQFLIGVSSATPAQQSVPADPSHVQQIDGLVAALMGQRVTREQVAATFGVDAEWRAADDPRGLGWFGFSGEPHLGLPAITAAILDQRGLSLMRIAEATQQGPLMIYPLAVSTPYGAGNGFWIFRYDADGLVRDFWDLAAWS